MTSTATNSYALLEEVRTQVLREPKSLRMNTFITKLAGQQDRWGVPRNRVPECGTIACVAGWVNVLRGHTGREQLDHALKQFPEVAHAALDRLFFDTWPENEMDTQWGDDTYAAYVAGVIQGIQHAFRRELKAFKLPATK